MVSDNEGGEKPVREQLQKAHIAPPPSSGEMTTPVDDGSNEKSEEAPQKTDPPEIQDEVLQDADAGAPRTHTRKRSRDSTAEEDELNNGQRKSGERSRDGNTETGATEHSNEANGTSGTTNGDRPGTPEVKSETRVEGLGEDLTSPKTKRKRVQTSMVEESAQVPSIESEKENMAADKGAKSKIAPTSGFANSSTTSPFSTLAKDRKSPSAEPPQTSSSAFASSGFGALTGSASGFGSVAKESSGFGSGGAFAKESSGFGSGGAFATGSAKTDGAAKPASSSAFGGSLGQKPAFAASSSITAGFASSSSGFGKLGQNTSSGFGSGLSGGNGGFGGGLSGTGLSFAKKPAVPFGSSAKPFGAPADDDDDEAEDDDEDGTKSPLSPTEDDKQDDRFYAQDLETGEEDETTRHTCRAKLYNFATLPDGKKEWRERGVGVLRLNVKKPADDPAADAQKARFLMRADGSHRVILNVPIQKSISYGDPNGEKPQYGYVYFMGALDGVKLEFLQLKMKQEFALQLYDKIAEIKIGM